VFTSIACAAPNWVDISAKVIQSLSILTVNVNQDNVVGYGDCTAFSINQAHHFYLTAAHCNGVDMRLGGYPVQIMLIDELKDLLVLQVPQLDQPILKLATKPVKMGQEVAAYGFEYGWPEPFIKHGLVGVPHLVNKTFGNRDLTMFNFSDIVGMSGGPVVDTKGNVVSIVQQANRDGQASIGADLDTLRKVVGIYWTE